MLHATNPDAPVLPVATIEGEPTAGTFFIKPLLQGDQMALMEVRLDAGAASGMHMHHHESLLYVVSGRLETTVGDDTFVLAPGDVCRHPAGVRHRVRALEPSLFVEVKSPTAGLGRIFGTAGPA